VLPAKETIEERACKLAQYIIEEKATVRAAAKQFGVSKSTVHIEVTL
jgi:putative DeoR family transcriptional regulator (stage III sporulation protein D)